MDGGIWGWLVEHIGRCLVDHLVVHHLVKMGVIWLFNQIWMGVIWLFILALVGLRTIWVWLVDHWVWLVVLALSVILWLVDAWLQRIRAKRRLPGRK
jgi:hypothetical protein